MFALTIFDWQKCELKENPECWRDKSIAFQFYKKKKKKIFFQLRSFFLHHTYVEKERPKRPIEIIYEYFITNLTNLIQNTNWS